MHFLLLILIFCRYADSQSPRVMVEHGELAGTSYSLPNGRVVYAFRGIPYAIPPVHKYRFKEPVPLKPWIGVWNATTVASSCLQFTPLGYQIEGEEDCLYLSVLTPKLPLHGVSPLLDVLVYIHGGAFMYGSGASVYPDYIMQNNDLVYVSINYRLGALGFFSTGDAVVPGNNGLKDQVAALRWVHHNIIKFGGNPASVTISGCSAGGASVHYQYLSPLSEGLFQRGISFSGSVLPKWALPMNNTEKSTHLAALVGCPTAITRDMVKCLRKRPARQILEIGKNFQTWRYCPFTAFGPTVEPAGTNAFLSEEPIQLLKSGKFKDLPWLISFNKDEGLYPAADFIGQENLLRELDQNWNTIAPNLFFYNYSVASEAEKDSISAAIREFYFGNKTISNDTIPNIVQALGDRAFFVDISRAAKLQSSMATQNVFCYIFKYRGKYSLTNIYANNFVDYGVSHADDVGYILRYHSRSVLETESDVATAKFMSSVIFNFMKTGDPKVNNLAWEPLTKNLADNLRCLFVNSAQAQEMGELRTDKAAEFWRATLPSEHPADLVDPNNTALKDELTHLRNHEKLEYLMLVRKSLEDLPFVDVFANVTRKFQSETS